MVLYLFCCWRSPVDGFWLTVVETGFLGRERGINKWKALAMVLFCIFTIPAALLILDFGSIHPEVFRLSLWGLFITFIMGIFLYNIVQVFRGRRKKRLQNEITTNFSQTGLRIEIIAEDLFIRAQYLIDYEIMYIQRLLNESRLIFVNAFHASENSRSNN